MNKKIVILIFILIILSALGGAYFLNSKKNITNTIPKQETARQLKISEEKTKEEIKQPEPAPIKVVLPAKKSYDLYSSTPYDLPLYSIMEIASLPDNLKKVIDNILENAQGFYLLKTDEGKIFIILQNPINSGNTYSRHDLEFVEINPDGTQHFSFAGYPGEEDEISNAVQSNRKDVWKFDKSTEPYKPLKHIKYNEKGKTEFTEFWDYSQSAEIKYEMKNSEGKTISVLKEILENDTNYRKEHIFYDNEGNTKMSLTVNFDGADITRFTYYSPEYSISIISEYTDGVKTKESVYNKDYELINILTADYENGERTAITLLDKNEAVLKKIEP